MTKKTQLRLAGNKRGGLRRVAKGLALLDPERRREIQLMGVAARRKGVKNDLMKYPDNTHKIA